MDDGITVKELSTGVIIANVTQHPLRFLMADGTVETIPSSGVVAHAERDEEEEPSPAGVTFVRVAWRPSHRSLGGLTLIRQAFPDAVIVGSLIAAQAHPGLVCCAIAAEGYERVEAAEKVVRPDRFTRF